MFEKSDFTPDDIVQALEDYQDALKHFLKQEPDLEEIIPKEQKRALKQQKSDDGDAPSSLDQSQETTTSGSSPATSSTPEGDLEGAIQALQSLLHLGKQLFSALEKAQPQENQPSENSTASPNSSQMNEEPNE